MKKVTSLLFLMLFLWGSTSWGQNVFFEGFENGNTQDLAPVGWTQVDVSGTATWLANTSLTTYNRTPRTGSWNAFLQYGNTDWMFKEVALSAGTTYELTFYARQDVASGANILASYGTEATAEGMVNPIIELSAVTNGDYQLFSGSFSPATSETFFIGIRADLNFSPWYISIDDISLDEFAAGTPAPPTDPIPANASADIPVDGTCTWTFGENTATYDLMFGPAGNMMEVVSGEDAGATGSYAYTGLNTSTTYEWQVIEYNGALTTNGPVWGFSTGCGVSAIPFSQDFDGTGFPPLCWGKYSGLLEDTITLTTTTSGWFSDDWRNITGTDKAAKANIWSTTFKYWLVTPEIDLGDGSTDYQLEFDLALMAYGGSNPPALTGVDDKFAVVISLDGGVSWYSANTLRLWDNAGSAFVYNEISNLGQRTIISLADYSGTVKLGFYGESTVSNADNELMINNLLIDVPADCPTPLAFTAENPTANSIDLSWTPGGDELLWDLVYGEPGFDPDAAGTLVEGITANPYTLEGLTAVTAYDAYVRADCETDEVSEWSSSVSFETLPTCPAPIELEATDVSTTSATLAWTALGEETAWDVAYGEPGFNPDSAGTILAVNTNPYLLDGLTVATAYEFFVRADCGTDEVSLWAGPVNFSTMCEALATFPWIETFEDDSETRICWNQIQEVETSNWTFNAGSSGGSILAAHNGVLNARFVSVTGDNSPITKLVTPMLDLSSIPSAAVTFYLGQEDWFGDQNETKVYYRLSPADAWVELLHVTENLADWTEYLVLLPELTATYQIAFEGINNFGRANVIDDVTVAEISLGSLEGIVTEAGVGPIENAMVYSGVYEGYTDADGYYNIPNILPGTYTFTCEAGGFLPVTAEVEIIADETATQDFELGAPVFGVDPTFLEEFLIPGETSMQTLTISNTGSTPLTWSASFEIFEPSKANYSAEQQLGKTFTRNFPKSTTVESSLSGFSKMNLGTDEYTTCPDGSIFSQPVETVNWGVASSELAPGYACYQYFTDLSAPIGGITFWGGNLVYSGGWSACGTEDPMTFTIKLYEDNAGIPGNEVASFTPTITRVSTGIALGTYGDFYMYQFSFDQSVFIPNGWVSIVGQTAEPNCWFMWASTSELSASPYLQWDGTAFSVGDYGLSLCFSEGEPSGSWLSMEPNSGTVDPGMDQVLDVTFDATQLLDGLYTADIHFNHNAPDPLDGTNTVPVTLTVESVDPPGVPSNPDPANASTLIPLQPVFSWTNGSGTAETKIKLLEGVGDFATLVHESEYFVGNSFDLASIGDTLKYKQRYSWIITCRNSAGETSNAAWFFQTIGFGNIIGTVSNPFSKGPLEGVTITAEEVRYTTETGPDGTYALEGILEGTYLITAKKDGYYPQTKEAFVAVPAHQTDTVDFVLELVLPPPFGLRAEVQNLTDVLLKWYALDGAFTEFRYDDGTATGQLGFGTGTTNSILGAVHRNNATINEITWWTTADGGPHTMVDVWILGLDSLGAPDGTQVLYHGINIPNTDAQWNLLTLLTPVEAPNGFLIGISYNGFAGLGTDDGLDAPWEFQPNTQYGVSDYTAFAFTAIENWGFPVNYLIRAVGVDNGSLDTDDNVAINGLPTGNALIGSKLEVPVVTGEPAYSHNTDKGLLSYDVYKDDLFLVNTPDTAVMDNGLAAGEYAYKVTAIYDEGESVAAGPVIASILAPPTLTIAEQVGPDVYLEWESNLAGAEDPYFNIWRAVDTGEFELLATTTDNWYFDETAALGSTYYYTISEVAAVGVETARSNEESVEVFCPLPYDLLTSDITDVSANLSWSGYMEDEWDNIIYGEPGFDPLTEGTLVAGLTQSPFLLDGLMSATSYDWYVRSYCDPDNIGLWAGPASFNTIICLPEDKCAYTLELDDSYGDGWNGAAVDIYQVGVFIGTYTIDDGYFSSYSVPLCDMTLTELYWVSGAYDSECSFTLLAPDGSTLYSFAVAPADGEMFFDFTTECPACPMPTGLFANNVTTTSADLNWTAGGSETEWNVLWGEAGFDPDTLGTLVADITVIPYLLEGLMENTAYDFYVQAVCGESVFSEFAGPAGFVTPCPNFPFPFYEDFTTVATGSIPDCWSIQGLGGTNWSVQASANAGGELPEMRFNWTPSFTGVSMLISPLINTTGNTMISLSFKHFLDWYSSTSDISVATTSDGITWHEVWLETAAANVGPDELSLLIDNMDVGSESFQFAFIFDGYTFDIDYWYIDDVALDVYVPPTQDILLAEGWSAWSSYMDPMTDAMFADVVAPVADQIIISQYFTEVYWPANVFPPNPPGPGINTMGDFSNAHGYVTKMNQAATLPVSGMMANATVDLVAGWNLLPVISDCDVNVTLLDSIPGFVIAWDIAAPGGVYYPLYGIRDFDVMVPGSAYWVKMDAPGSFTFPECTPMDNASAFKPYNFVNTTDWEVNYSGVSHAVIFDEIAASNLLAGDIVGAFTADGTCAGIAEVQGGSFALKAFADDNTTLNPDGFVEAETLNYKVYRQATGEVFILGVTYDFSAPNTGLFATNGLSVVSDLTMSVTGINTQMLNGLSVYPNPSTGIFNISIGNLDQDINYVIVNAKGQEIFEAKLLETQEIDLSSAPKGIYFIKFISNEVLRIEKVVIK